MVLSLFFDSSKHRDLGKIDTLHSTKSIIKPAGLGARRYTQTRGWFDALWK